MTHDTLTLDVLIVGAGPAGLMAGAWMARTGVKTLIIDQKPCRTQAGHADGIESRTLEILDSFGIGEDIWKKANRTIDLALWNEHDSDGIQRDEMLNNSNPGLSRFQEATLGQGEIEQKMIDMISTHKSVEIRWNTTPSSMDIRDESSSHPIVVRARTKIPNNEHDITINTKYVVGCDGARSWVRGNLGLKLEGDRFNEDWGVFDSIPVTDFPDIRKRCIIKSDAGNLMVIPREGRLVRCYVQLSHETATTFKAHSEANVLIDLVRRILYPYSFEASQIEWSTIYSVGQRLCGNLSMYNRVFLAGDAVHTHSPKAGQGMNVSIQDTYNLGWKLASVVKEISKPSILRTYQDERLAVAMRLIAFDKRMVQGVCGKDSERSKNGKSSKPDSLKGVLEEENTSASGLTVRYRPNILITPTWEYRATTKTRASDPLLPHSKSELAANLAVGARFPSTQVLCQSDSRPWHIQQALSSTGKWHLLVFGGDISNETQMKRVQDLGLQLSKPSPSIHRMNESGDDVGKLEIYLIHSAPRHEIELLELPDVFRPFDRSLGFDYWKVFADNQPYGDGRGSAHQTYGIGREGCLALVRPDQVLAFIGCLEDSPTVERYFANFTVDGTDSPMGSSCYTCQP